MGNHIVEKAFDPNIKQLYDLGTNEEKLYAIEMSKPYFSTDDNATMIVINAALEQSSESIHKAGMEALYECFHRFIHTMVMSRYSAFANWYEDMINEAFIAILEHLNQYDPNKGRPSTFFELQIKNVLNHFIAKNILNTTPHYTNIDRKLVKAMNELEEEGIAIEPQSIQKKCKNMTLEQIKTGCERLNKTCPVHELGYNTVEEDINDKMIPEDIFIRREERKMLYEVMNHILTEKERKIITLKFKLGSYGMDSDEITIKIIADRMELSTQQVRSIIVKAYRKLNKVLSNVFLEEHDRNDKCSSDTMVINNIVIPFRTNKATEKLFEIEIDI